ncbi:MAG: diacylglycerol/lipid kinase family protein [Pyrinomonadaceae bacterium]
MPLVIVNPRSAGGKTGDSWASLASDLRAHFGPFKVAFTKASGDGITLAQNAADSGRKFIIACGGDGTINEVANGIMLSGKDVELGILPSGTGGDFRRSIEMPDEPREAARALKKGKTRAIDVGKVTFQDFNDKTVSRYFLNISSFGLAAAIIQRVKTSTSLDWLPVDMVRGPASFALSTLQEVLGLDTTRVRVKVGERPERILTTVNFCIANAMYFGGGMKIAPSAKLTDGCFDVVNIGDMKSAKIILNVYTLYRGTHLTLPEVKATRAKRVEAHPLDPAANVMIEVDGELPGKLPAVFEIVPTALKLRIPS